MKALVYALRDELYSKPRTPITVESLFEDCPEGEFHWDGEPGDDEVPYVCDDKDCEHSWHKDCQFIEMGRDKHGKTYFVVLQDSISGSGSYQPVGGWDEREGDEITTSILEDLWYDLEGRVIEYYANWALYYLDCAETQEDPLESFMFGLPPKEKFIESAEEHIRTLETMLARIESRKN